MQLLERSDLITSSHASHVIRTLAEVMSGVKVQANVVKGKHARQGTYVHPPTLSGRADSFAAVTIKYEKFTKMGMRTENEVNYPESVIQIRIGFRIRWCILDGVYYSYVCIHTADRIMFIHLQPTCSIKNSCHFSTLCALHWYQNRLQTFMDC